MTPDLSVYPPTQQGAEDLMKALLPMVIRLWKTERQGATDDVVAVINAHTGSVSVRNRTAVYAQLNAQNLKKTAKKRVKSKADLLSRLKQSAPSRPGAVTIWALIGFQDGTICIKPMLLARS